MAKFIIYNSEFDCYGYGEYSVWHGSPRGDSYGDGRSFGLGNGNGCGNGDDDDDIYGQGDGRGYGYSV